MDLQQLAAWIPRIELELQRSYGRARPGARDPPLSEARDILQEFTLRGGKRLRAMLVLAGFHLVRGGSPAPAIAAAAAIEHFQSWMLIHDDIIDHAETRRDGPTVHRALASRHATDGLEGSAEAYGLGMAITLGDLQEAFTVEGLLRCAVSPARRLAALSEYVRMTRETAYGQLLDIRNGMRPIEFLTERDVLEVHRRKTAAYTVAGPLGIGARLGGAGPGLLADLASAGTDLGVAFQLRDDVLGTGLGGQPIGKSANDLAEGKRTLLVVHAWFSADSQGRALLREVLGRPPASPERIEEAKALIRDGGSLAYSEALIEQLSQRALRRIGRSRSLKPAGKSLLGEVAGKLVRRAF